MLSNKFGVLSLKKIEWSSCLVLLLILVFAGFLRGWRLGIPDSQYFDECYYVPGAMSYIYGTVDENSVHPPLGKLQIANFILLGRFINSCVPVFSEQMLSRLASWAYGEGTVLLAFMLSFRLSRGNVSLASLAAFFVAVDFMSIVMSRICMLDMVLAFWMMLGVYCCWMHIEAQVVKSPRAFSWAVLCAMAFGVASACKWNGIFGAFTSLVLMVLLPELISVKDLQRGMTEGYSLKTVFFKSFASLKSVKKRILKRTIMLAAVFVVIMASIYTVSYTPQFIREGFKQKTFSNIVDNHMRMIKFRYDAEQFTHHYCSQFWAWPTVIRPVWFKFDASQKIALGIVCFGSILFWWPGFTFVLEFFYLSFKDQKWIWLFISSSWIFPWLFWAVSTTGGFIYYMLPGIPLLSIVMAWVLYDWYIEGYKAAVAIYLAALGCSLACYYPFLTYLPMKRSLFATLFPVIFTQWR
ncbi:MAG: phospholipid carrier-dependent glycosyltransferase [Candidatus Bruticola sp.]